MKSKLSILILLTLLLTLMVTAVQAANDLYVAPGGSDTSDCQDDSAPCATIAYAISQAADGDTIHVAAGTFSTPFTINKQVTLLGPNAGVAGYAISRAPEAMIENAQINVTGAGPVVIDGFHIYQTNNTTDAILLGGGSAVTVQNNIIEREGVTTGVSARGLTTSAGSGTKLIKANLFTGDVSGGLFGGHKTWNSGVYINGASSTVALEDNRFENTRTGMNLDDFGAGISVTGNVFDNNGTHIAFGGTTPTGGQFTLGANEFGAPASAFVNLSNVATTFRLDITASTFGGYSAATLDLADQFLLEYGMYHRGRSGRNGLVTYVANTQFVIPVNPGIQSAVNMAENGGVIFVADSTYYQNVTINKPLTLNGQSETGTILDGTSLTGRGILINSGITDVTIQNLTVQNFLNPTGSGIWANGGNNNFTAQNVTVNNNGVVGGAAGGLYMNGPVDNVLIDNVTAHNNRSRGIVIWNGFKTNITITNSDVQDNNCCGIELQDGTASGVTITGNLVQNNVDNGIGVVGLTSGAGPNLIANNVLDSNGRFGIEIKNPDGSGLDSGDGSIVVENNTVSLTTPPADLRDYAGIAAFRRGVLPGNVDIPTGVIIRSNTVSNYSQTNVGSNSTGFGIVVEGTNMTVQGNTLEDNNVGVQVQAGHLPYPGDGDQANLDDDYFGRGNSPIACASVSGNTYTGNGVDYRIVGPAASDAANAVYNVTQGTYHCTIQAAIDAADDDDTIQVAAGTYAESISVYIDGLTLRGPNAEIDPNGVVARGLEAIIRPASSYGFYVTAQDVTIDGFTIDGQGTALYGIYAYTTAGKGGLLLTNNIVKDIATYGFIGWVQSGTPSSENLVSRNRFESIPGRSIVALWNYYANVTDNVVRDTAVAIYAENANQPEATGLVEWARNDISATRSGIWYNLVYGTATPLTIADNIINVEDNPVGTRWDGIWLTSLGGSINPTISGNVITGAPVTQLTIGYHMWHNTTTAADGIVVQGGTVTDVDYGVWINNWDGYPTVGGSNAGRSTAKLEQVVIDGAALAGVYLKDNPLNTSGASAYVFANIQDSDITNSAIGILVDGEDASVQVAESRLYNNTQNMVNNNAAVTMDATPNWWGTPCNPGSTIVGPVDYSPWWGDPNGSYLVDSTTTSFVVPDGATTAEANAIFACAPPYGTVEFAEDGVFDGGIFVTTPGLTINLNGGTVGAGSPAFTIAAADVTIQGPGVLDGDGDASPGVLVVAGGDNFTLKDAEVRNWADGVVVAANVISFKLFNNWIHSNADAGLQINSGVTLGGVVSIQGNLFKVNGGNGIQHDGNGTLPAEYNSWGDVGGPASGDGVGGNVDADPWTFAEVYLDVDPTTVGDQYQRSVNEGDTFTVTLMVEAANLYGLSFRFSYDNTLLTFNGTPTFSAPWAGTCFDLNGLAANEIGYQCALTGGPEWDGGTVATFNFTANGSGLTGNGPWPALFDISHEVADTSAGAIGGAKVFVNNAGFNDPSVADRDITDTNDGQIDITGLANFTGYVDLQGRFNDSGAVVEVFNQQLKAGSTLLAQGTSADSGAYTTDVNPNQLLVGTTYYFQINRPLFLPTTAIPITNYGHSKVLDLRPLTTLATVVLLGGDADNDNVIGIGDATCIGGVYGSTTPGLCGNVIDSSPDVNGDGVVNILDLTLMGGNYEKNSSPWTP